MIHQNNDSHCYYSRYHHHSGVVALTDGNGDLAAYYEYDAWGNTMTEAEKTGVDNPYRYSTKEWNEKSGLVYFGASYCSPEVGRRTRRHPAGIVDRFKLYAYAENDPVAYIDPVGLVEGDVRGPTFEVLPHNWANPRAGDGQIIVNAMLGCECDSGGMVGPPGKEELKPYACVKAKCKITLCAVIRVRRAARGSTKAELRPHLVESGNWGMYLEGFLPTVKAPADKLENRRFQEGQKGQKESEEAPDARRGHNCYVAAVSMPSRLLLRRKVSQ